MAIEVRIQVHAGMFPLRHLMFKSEFPDKGQGRDFPFKNVTNARPETIDASKPRIDPDKVPFDPRAVSCRFPNGTSSTEAGASVIDNQHSYKGGACMSRAFLGRVSASHSTCAVASLPSLRFTDVFFLFPRKYDLSYPCWTRRESR